MANINFNTRQQIVAQALQEISFARTFKQGKTKNWKTNEDLYYGRKVKSDEARANVDLGQMSGFVHTLLSKIDNPLVFKFVKRKDAQLKRVQYLNALRQYDAKRDNWNIKDLVGKKQAAIYGRAIYSYSADSVDGYKPHLDNVDVYDFLIDPSAGGVDIERAMYMGDYGVVKTKQQLKAGVKSGIYLKTETERLIEGASNATESSQEETNKQSRTYDTNVYTSQKEITGSDKFKFWRWVTTFEGERYYLLITEKGATAVELCLLKDKFKSNLFPYWTYAAFLDLTEFWAPSYCDYVRELYMAENVSINQMLDNAEAVNKPQKVVNVGAIENLGELKYRKDGYIRVKKEFDVEKALQTVKVASIDTPLAVFDKLEAIADRSLGVNAGAQGVASEDGKVAIYEGNQANTADRFGLFNKSYSFGYDRFGQLWEAGVDEHLIKKEAVDILGPDGVEVVEVSRRDIFRKGEKFNITTESSDAELALSMADKKTKLMFLSNNAQNPMQNPTKAYEISATIAGFDEETIRQLQDTSDYGNAGLMSEAERDIEALIDGEAIQPNQNATTAYKQRFVDYMRDNQENLDKEQFTLLANYVNSLDEIINRNMVRQANDFLFKQKMESLKNPAPVTPAPTAQLRQSQGGAEQLLNNLPQ